MPTAANNPIAVKPTPASVSQMASVAPLKAKGRPLAKPMAKTMSRRRSR